MPPTELITLEDIRRAARSIAGVAVRTPLLASPAVPDLLLKPESLQPTGAFKIRGAMHALARLSPRARAAGVITHSSGNHGQALAFAARHFQTRCVVVMPETSPNVKIEAVRALGAVVELVAPHRRESRTAELVAQHGFSLIPPHDHPDIIAGQGTAGLEIVEDGPSDLAAVLVPVGGGGLASGVVTAVKALRPDVRVIGVEPELAADAAESLARGTLTRWPVERTYRTVADGLRTNLSELTLAHLRARLDGIVTVTEEEIRAAVITLVRAYRLVAEPSGAVAPAAFLYRASELRERFRPGRGPVVAIVSGGNVDPDLLASSLATLATPQPA